MIFNGLSKSDLVVYNALADMLSMSPRRQISNGQIANKTGYNERTVRLSLKRLEVWELVDRDQPAPGTPYEYRLVEK